MHSHLSAVTFNSILTLSKDTDSTLGVAINQAIGVIDQILDDHGESKVSISFNGGKDCTVLLHILAVTLWQRSNRNAPLDKQNPDNISFSESTGLPFNTIYITYDSPFPSVETFINVCVKQYRLAIFRTTPEHPGMKDALQSYKDEHKDVTSILLGTRRDDPNGANLDFVNDTDSGWPNFKRVHPILCWSYKQIWEYLRRFDVPYCDLYDQGYTSLGSQANTSPNPALKREDGGYDPAYMLEDGTRERDGRLKDQRSSEAETL